MKKEYKGYSLAQINEVVEAIFRMGQDIPIWTFEGNLGAGKTTLIKALAEKIHLHDEVSSPTFNYVNNYDNTVYHFDCYRLNNIQEVLNLGFEEYLDSGKRCWIEWPEVILPLIQEPYLKIETLHNAHNLRDYRLEII